MKVADKAYIAGLLDGEGTITVAMLRPQMTRQLRVYIYNTDKMVLDWVAAVTGIGTIAKANGTNKPIYMWRCSTGGALEFLKQIAPYMKIKRAQAEVALQFPMGKPWSHLTEDQQDKRKEIHQKIWALNGPNGARRAANAG